MKRGSAGPTSSTKAHPPNVRGLNGEDVRASGLKVVPEVIVGNGQGHLVSVTLPSVQLHEHPGVRAGSVHAACLDRYVVADVLSIKNGAFVWFKILK